MKWWLSVAIAYAALHAPVASAASFQTVYTFKDGTDFIEPESTPAFHNGVLYGLARMGGGAGCRHDGCGGFYSVDLATGVETILRHYKPSPKTGLSYWPVGSLQFYKGLFYTGNPYGGLDEDGYLATLSLSGYGHILYSFDTAVPTLASLTLAGQVLYGSASPQQDIGKPGMVFKLDPSTHAVTILSTLPGGDGTFTMSAPVVVGDTIYATAGNGSGPHRNGYILSYNLTTGVTTDLYDFKGKGDGNDPSTLLVFKGRLYGTSDVIGPSSSGTCGDVFSFDPTDKKFRIVHAFSGNDGCSPNALVVLGNLLYGVTSGGGTPGGGGVGALFSVDPQSGAETVLHGFTNTSSSDEEYPYGLTAGNGTLYGTVSDTIYSFTP